MRPDGLFAAYACWTALRLAAIGILAAGLMLAFR